MPGVLWKGLKGSAARGNSFQDHYIFPSTMIKQVRSVSGDVSYS